MREHGRRYIDSEVKQFNYKRTLLTDFALVTGYDCQQMCFDLERNFIGSFKIIKQMYKETYHLLLSRHYHISQASMFPFSSQPTLILKMKAPPVKQLLNTSIFHKGNHKTSVVVKGN